MKRVPSGRQSEHVCTFMMGYHLAVKLGLHGVRVKVTRGGGIKDATIIIIIVIKRT